MRGLVVACVTLLPLVAARSAGAKDPPAPPAADARHDLGRHDAYAAGDVVTITIVERDEQRIRVFAGPDRPPVETKRASTLSAVVVAKCLLADAAVNATRTSLFVRQWSLDNGRTKDLSLEGARVEARGRGKDRVFGLLATGPRGAPTAGARRWLEDEWGPQKPDADTARRAWLPKAPVEVGKEWAADLEPLLARWFAGKPVDRAKATATSRLLEVQRDVAILANEARIPLTGLPGAEGGAPLPWTKGGAFDVQGEMTVPLSGRLAGSLRSVRGFLEGEAEREGRTVSLVLSFEMRRAVTLGGEMPPEAEAPSPPPEPIPAEPVPGMEAPADPK